MMRCLFTWGSRRVGRLHICCLGLNHHPPHLCAERHMGASEVCKGTDPPDVYAKPADKQAGKRARLDP